MSQKVVLIVEDHLVAQHVTQILLESYEAQTVCTENGATALALSKEQSFDLILVDLGLPDYDGLELIRDLKLLQKSAYFIGMTTYVTQDMFNRAIAEGYQTLLEKPITEYSMVGEKTLIEMLR